MWDNLVIDGFQFENAEAYAKAKREAEAIEYIKLKTDLRDPRTAAKVYYKLLEKQTLQTVVGLSFLKQLRDYIISEGIVKEEDLKCITVASRGAKEVASIGDETSLEMADSEQKDKTEDLVAAGKNPFVESDEEKERKMKSVVFYYRQKAKKTTIVIVALVMVIIAMFVITLNSDASPFADAEASVQDKYASWAEELKEWEEELKYREQQLEGHLQTETPGTTSGE